MMKTETAPKVFIYNPTCEIAIANGTLSFMPNKTLSKFESDLDVLPLYFANENDVLLVRQIPDEKFLNTLLNAGISLPKFRLLKPALQDHNFINIPKQNLQAWGWSPRIHHILKPLKASCSKEFLNQPNAFWKDEHRKLYGRETGLKVLKSFLKDSKNDQYISENLIARVCTHIEEIENLIEEWKQIVIKAPLSSSGRGLQVLRKSYLNDSISQWIKGTLDTQGYVTVEALVDKKHDFSLQYFCNGKGNLNFLGLAFFETNTNGQYGGNILGGMPKNMINNLPQSEIEELSEGILRAIKTSDIAMNYTGYFGVDCMLFDDANGNRKIQPCVEINLRYNMGILALILDKYLAPETTGTFKMIFKPKSTFDLFHEEMEKKHPFEMKDGKWVKGYLPLVSPYQNKNFGAYILLENTEK